MPSNKRIDVTLGFTADTQKVKAQLKALKKQISDLITEPTRNPISISKELQEASVAAATLKTQLDKATNVNTGTLDLGKFTRSLKESGYKLEDYQKALRNLGIEGNKAFASLAKSILYAEAPLKKTNAMIDRLAKTFKNVVSWQISSSTLNLFTGTLKDAYSYAKSLDASLNSIRIVTGKTTDQMASFAVEANKAAKALSTTTTAYTDASLIFFQQGLPEAEVRSRTDAVIKMSNVTGEAAADVSSYMTAIWNNFAKGNKDLESFADTITALGAATASSTKEIAGGLEKFSAVANQIGLSYEYATTALATVVARTRQSEDIVGTAFKTIFARLQSLSLGETLDDDTNLTKYSKALAGVGVSIKDTQGELKSMDDILDDLGSKWDNLSRAQQTALAQTVAGQRQYNQFIALMDSWNTDFQQNLATANNAEGTLQNQADIYAESWEAAHKRVTASWQGLYDELIDEKFFINIENGVSSLIDLFNNFIKGLGGVEGLLLSIGSILTSVFAKQGANAIDDLLENMYKLSSQGKDEMLSLKKEANDLLKSSFETSVYGDFKKSVASAYESTRDLQEKFINNADIMTDQQKRIVQLLMDQHTQLVNNVDEYSKENKELEKIANLSKNTAVKAFADNPNVDVQSFYTEVQQTATTKDIAENFIYDLNKTGDLKQDIEQYKLSLEQLKKTLDSIGKTDEEVFGAKGKKVFDNFKKVLESPISSAEELQKAIDDVENSIDSMEEELESKSQGFTLSPSVVQYERLEESFNRIRDLFDGSFAESGLTGPALRKAFSDTNIKPIKEEIKRIKDEIINSGSNLSEAFGDKGAEIFGLMEKHLTDGRMSINTYSETIEALISDYLKPYKKECENTTTATKEQVKALKEGIKAYKDLGTSEGTVIYANTQVAKTTKTIEEYFKNLKNAGITAGQAVMTVTSSVTALMSAYKAFINIQEISTQITEGQIDSFEGLTQIFSSLAFVIPNVATNLTKVYNIFNKAGLSALKAGAATGGVTIAIIALIAAINGLIKLYQKYKANTPEGQLKSAKERAAELNTELENTKSKAEEVKSTFDTYTEIKKNLDECTKGTKEWYEALDKANDSALELIKQFPQLLIMVNEAGESAVTFNKETGNTEVANWAMEQIATEAQRQNAITQFTSVQTNKDVLTKQLEVEKNNFIDSFGLVSNLSEKQLETFLNEFSQNKYRTANKEDLINQLYEYFITAHNKQQHEIPEFKTATADQVNKIAEGIINNLSGFNDRLEDINKAAETQNKAYLTSLVRNNTKAKNSQYTNQIVNAIANGFNNYKANEIDFNSADENKKDNARERFIKYIDEKADKSTIKEKDGNITYKRIDGTSQKVELTTATFNIQSAEALEIAEANIPQVSKVLENLYNGSGHITKNTAEFIGEGNLDKLSSKEIFSNASNLSEQTFGNLLKVFGLTEELLNNLGYTVKELLEGLQQSIKDYKTAEEETKKDLITQRGRSAYALLANQRQNLNIKEQETLVSILNKTSAYGGEKATTNTGLLFNKFSGEQLKTFLSNISTIDWNSVDVKTFKDTLSELGIQIELEDNLIQSFVESMRLTTSKTIKTIQENYATKKKIIDSLDVFSSISVEDFEKLGKDFKDFFMELDDGSYALIKSSEELKIALQNLQKESLEGFYKEKSKEYKVLSNDLNGDIKLTPQEIAQTQLEIVLSYANNDTNITNKVAELKEKLEDNTGFEEIDSYFKEITQGQLNLSEELEKRRKELKSTIISLLLASEDINQAIDGLSEEDKKLFTKEELDNIKKYTVLQGESADRIQEIVKYSEQLAKALNNDLPDGYESFEELAKSILDSNDAITLIKDNFSSWETILRNSSTTSKEYVNALEQIQKAVSTLFGIQKEAVTTEFLEANRDAFEQLSQGVTSVKLTTGQTITQKDYLNLVNYNEELDKYAKYLKSIGEAKTYEEAFDIARQVTESNEAIKTLTNNFESWNEILLAGDAKKGSQDYQSALEGVTNVVSKLFGITEIKAENLGEILKTLAKIINGDLTVSIGEATIANSGLLNAVPKAEELIPPILQTTQEYLHQEEVLKNLNKEYENLNKTKSLATEKDQIEIIKQQNELLEQQASVYKDLDRNYQIDLAKARDNIDKRASEIGGPIKFNDNGSIDLKSYQEYVANEQNRINQIINPTENQNAQDELNKYKEIIEAYIDIWDKASKNSELLKDAEYEKLQNIIEIKEIEIKIKLDTEEAEEKLKDLREDDYDRSIKYKNKELEDIEKQIDESNSYKEKKSLINQAKSKVSDIAKDTNRRYDEAKADYDATGIDLSKKTSEQYQREINLTRENKLSALQGMDVNSVEYQTALLQIENEYKQESENLQKAISLYEEMNNIKEDIIDLDEKNKKLAEQEKQLKIKERQKYIDVMKQAGESINSIDVNQFRAEGSKNYNFAQMQGMIGDGLEALGDTITKINEGDFGGAADALANGIKTMLDNAQEKYMAKIDQVLDNWDELGEKFQTIINSLDHYSNVAELLYGPNSNKTKELKKQANEAKITTSLGNMEKQKVEKQKLTEQLSKMREGDADYEKVKTQLDELNAEMEQSVESHLQLVKEQYSLAISEIMDNFEKEMTGGESLSKISERWQDSQELAKGYYDEVEKVYQIESLRNTLEKDIAGAASAKEQQKITQFMQEQMKILKSKNKLSEQDMLIAQKKYDILKAEIELEDARNNKNTMKLTRGSDGNWSYQYIANTDDVLDKQQQLRDANNKLYSSMKSNFTNLSSDIPSIMKTANQRITEIVSEMDTADSERYAELEVERERLTEFYYGSGGILSQKYSEYLQARDELTQISGQDMLAFEDKTVTEMANKWKNDPDSLKNSALNAYNSMSTAQANVAKEIEKATKAIGENFTNVEANINASTEAAKRLGEQVTELGNQTEGIYEMKKAVDVLKVAWMVAAGVQIVSTFLIPFTGPGKAAIASAALAAVAAGDVIAGLAGFDTGGYTGNWGKDGKMAMLHEKELVLNKDDTANMLETVSAVRDISSIGESVSSNIENGVNNMVASSLDLPNTDLSGNISNSEANTNNTFEITMNVDGGNVEEIKEAIFSLPTLANQYLSKNQK